MVEILSIKITYFSTGTAPEVMVRHLIGIVLCPVCAGVDARNQLLALQGFERAIYRIEGNRRHPLFYALVYTFRIRMFPRGRKFSVDLDPLMRGLQPGLAASVYE